MSEKHSIQSGKAESYSYLIIREPLVFGLFAGIFTYAFLIIFRPFGVDNNSPESFTWEVIYQISIWSLYGTIIIMITGVIFRLLLIRIFYIEWNAFWQISWYAFTILVTGIFNALYHTLLCGFCENSLLKFLEFTGNTFLILIFPIVIFDLCRRLKAKESPPDPLDQNQVKQTGTKIISSGEKEKLVVRTEDMVYIHADDNYLEIWIHDDGKLIKRTIRKTLKDLEIMQEPKWLRCHRSFMINVLHVESIYKKAGKTFVAMRLASEEIPVSKSYESILQNHFTTNPPTFTPNR